MSFKIKTISVFEKQAKRLTKKYASLKNELLELVQELKETPELGIPIGKSCYKIRMVITAKGKGKSGGARLITYVIIEHETLYLLSIYDKSYKENLTDKELEELLKAIP